MKNIGLIAVLVALLVVLVLSAFNSVETAPKSLLVEYRLDRGGVLTISDASWDETTIPKGDVINVFKGPVTFSFLHPGPSEVYMMPLASEYIWLGSVKGNGSFTFTPNVNDIVNISCQKAKAKPLFNHGANGMMVTRGWGVLTIHSYSTTVLCP